MKVKRFKKVTQVVEFEVETTFLANQILERRKKAKFSQQDLSEKLNVSRSSVSNMENGNHDISLKILEKLCKIFNCSSADLLGF
ncbi:hypothetical protein AS589_09330 [Empedobacter brevis]|uniref:helix-turn-helix transcriptional regulator n=1 Tax=Empedobacter brevis TaxID=247 RepID=UPI00131FCB47|nr:helix-turn-helix transcriptional regulator [Empedobacter brevis]QHC84957.1 hypothetical protein AS589_09330 [Empedobacter brevis]